MARKILIILIIGLLMINCIVAATNSKPIPKEIEGIGTAYRYRTCPNITVETNFNIELLFIAAATGSGFTHRGYGGRGGVFDGLVREHYQEYQQNKLAQSIYHFTNRIESNPSKKFDSGTVLNFLAYREVLSDKPIENIIMNPNLGQESVLNVLYHETVFSSPELLNQYNQGRRIMIQFLYILSFGKGNNVNYQTLRENRIIPEQGYWSFLPISNENYQFILREAKIDDSYFID